METQKLETFVDQALGFPVQLHDVTMIKVRDEWVPKIDYPRLIPRVLEVLSHLDRPLTGQEVRFIRLHFALTQGKFAAQFGLSHVAIHKWEKRGDQATGMQWSTEKDLRLFVQSKLTNSPKQVGELYEQLSEHPARKQKGSSSALALASA